MSLRIQTHIGKDGTRSALVIDSGRKAELGGDVIVASFGEAEAVNLYSVLGDWLHEDVVVEATGTFMLVHDNRGTWRVRDGSSQPFVGGSEGMARAEYARLTGRA